MVVKFNNDKGLILHIIKLNGKLQIRFTADGSLSATYTLQGSDVDHTPAMKKACRDALGPSLLSPGLELFLEEVHGSLKLDFVGATGGTLRFEFNGVHVPKQEQRAITINSDNSQEETRPSQPVVKSTPATSTETAEIETGQSTMQGIHGVLGCNDEAEPNPRKRQAADYTSYKHIFMEGYRSRTRESSIKKGTLHADLFCHKVFFRCADEMFGSDLLSGWRGFDLLQEDVSNPGVGKARRYQITYAMRSFGDMPFSMNYCSRNAKVFGNNDGSKDERFTYTGENRFQAMFDAVQECLDYNSKVD